MTATTIDHIAPAHEEDEKGWRDGLKDISNCLFDLANDQSYDLPNWFRRSCEQTSVYVLDPIVDILSGQVPKFWKRGLHSAVGNVNSIMLRQK